MDVRDGVIGEIEGLLARREKATAVGPIVDQTALYGEGLALDSLEVAELSALLEARFGRDPFTEGTIPQTVGEILEYYAQVGC